LPAGSPGRQILRTIYIGGEKNMTEPKKEEELDALCPECGHAFKVYMDRMLDENQKRTEMEQTKCPVCGCGGCTIGE
jgi:hypothetical protein